ASSGIGKAIATKLADEGINVVLVARRENKLTTLAEKINKKAGGKALAVPTDVSNRNEIENMVQQAKDKFGAIDVYVNNAGLMLHALVTEGQVENWEQMIDVNIKGVLYGVNAVIPSMLERKT